MGRKFCSSVFPPPFKKESLEDNRKTLGISGEWIRQNTPGITLKSHGAEVVNGENCSCGGTINFRGISNPLA